ncbi:MAG: hypothetical protein ACYTG0_31165, partial [Planctomycetota bacterium]|jgi:hypothetical protein
VLYPVVDAQEVDPVLKGVAGMLGQSRRPVGRLGGRILGGIINQPPKARIYFLFQGDSPLELVLQSRRANTFVARPTPDPAAYRRILEAWWSHYAAVPGALAKVVEKPDYPPQVENYLQSMLARRLGLPLPPDPAVSSFQQEVGLFLGTESILIGLERQRFLGSTGLNETADRPLPEPIVVPDLRLPDLPDDVAVEPIAMRVPEECMYVRFGSFSNFLWTQDMLTTWGGDLANLVALRGLDYESTARMEDCLVLKQTAMARLFGETVIADVAILASDTFYQEGAAFGLLFHARNNLLIGSDFNGRRSDRVKQSDGVTEQTVKIAGRDVSLLSSPDGRVRSFYAADGDFHFVTRSEALVRRFLETGSGQGALGASEEFRHARTVMPLERDDTVFLYVSDAFFRNLVGPRLRVEALRRLQATADVELVQLAVLAAAAEGQPADTVEQLIAGGFLPQDFGVRPDGSYTVLAGGEVYDSLRGRRGSFLPVPDTPLEGVSPSELTAYDQFCQFYRSNWGRLDPIVAGIRRASLDGNREQVVADVRMAPFSKENYQRMQHMLGPPDPAGLAPIPGDVIAGEAVLSDQRVFGALREIRPPSQDWLQLGILRGFMNVLVGYIGTTGDAGLLGLLDPGAGGPARPPGYGARRDGLFQRRYGPFTVFSLQPEVLAAVPPQLRYEEARRPAQIRLRVEDVTQDPIAPMLNNLGYARTQKTSLGNVRLMHDLAQQLHVPGPFCKEAAELLLGAKLICPLGGEYVFQEIPGGAGYWTSTAMGDRRPAGLFSTQAPHGFVAPPLSWFRGLDLDATVTPEVVSVHAEVVMQMPGKVPAPAGKD